MSLFKILQNIRIWMLLILNSITPMSLWFDPVFLSGFHTLLDYIKEGRSTCFPSLPCPTQTREWSAILQMMILAKQWYCPVNYSLPFDAVLSSSFSVYGRFYLWKQSLCFSKLPIQSFFVDILITYNYYYYYYYHYCCYYMSLLIKDNVLWKRAYSHRVFFTPNCSHVNMHINTVSSISFEYEIWAILLWVSVYLYFLFC